MFASDHPILPRRPMWPGLLAVLLGCAAVAPSFGQSPSREQEQIRRLRQQVQQLQQEQATQQQAVQKANADKADAQGKLVAAQAELRRLRGSATAQSQSLVEAQKDAAALREEGVALQARAEALRQEGEASSRELLKLRATNAELQQSLALRGAAFVDLESRHANQARGLQMCIANNREMQALGQDLLKRYASKGVLDVMAQNEPFLQFNRVALENLVQGYQDKLDQQALKPPPAGAEAVRAP